MKEEMEAQRGNGVLPRAQSREEKSVKDCVGSVGGRERAGEVGSPRARVRGTGLRREAAKAELLEGLSCTRVSAGAGAGSTAPEVWGEARKGPESAGGRGY